MQVQTTTTQELSATDLAKTLAQSSPQEFADFWHCFVSVVREADKDLMPYAEALSFYDYGRKESAIVELAEMVKFCQMKRAIDQKDPKVTNHG